MSVLEAYVGYVGGGKTLNAVDRILRQIARGGCVYTNIKLCMEPWNNEYPKYKGKFNDEFNAMGVKEYLKKYYNWEYQEGQYNYISNEELMGHGITKRLASGSADIPVLVVWDECSDFFNVDDRRTVDKEFISLVTHSRKYHLDMIFIIQSWKRLNANIRENIMYVWRFIDFDNFVFPGICIKASRIPWLRNMIRCLRFHSAQYDSSRLTAEPVEKYNFAKNQDLFSCYKTEAVHSFADIQSNVKTDFRGQGNIDIKDDVCLWASAVWGMASSFGIFAIGNLIL